MDKQKLQFLRQNIQRSQKARARPWPCTITAEDAYRQGEQQGWLCAITGTALEFTRGGGHWQNKWCNPNSCTIDRVDPTQGYHKDNIQLLTHRANTWKSNFTHAELEVFALQFLARHKSLSPEAGTGSDQI